MTKMGNSVKISLVIVLYIELCFVVQCFGSEHCTRVDGRYLCYFTPFGANKNGEEWERAWQVCRDNGGSLPVVENKTVQALVEKFMKTEVPGQEMWAAGRGMRSNMWHWLNGEVFQDASKMLDNHDYLSQVFDTHAIITYDQRMSGRYPSDKFNSVCQFSGSVCQSKNAISFGEGCLKSVTNESLRWYDARNLCLENGGDLPIFESPLLMNRTQEVFVQMEEATGIWIGLRKTWWNWKRTDSTEEILYTNWLDHDNYINRECMILAADGKSWKQQFCRTAKRFFCQATKSDLYAVEALKVQTTDVNSDYPHKMTITVGISIPVVIFIAVASVLLATKCKMCSSGGDRTKDRSYHEMQLTVNGQVPVTSNGLNTDLRPLDRSAKPNQPEPQSHQNTMHEQIWIARETDTVVT